MQISAIRHHVARFCMVWGVPDGRRAAVPVVNAEIANQLDKLADLLGIKEARSFRIRSYQWAARLVGECRMAKDPGLKVAISTDAHAAAGCARTMFSTQGR
jgi:hypothetical protein